MIRRRREKKTQFMPPEPNLATVAHRLAQRTAALQAGACGRVSQSPGALAVLLVAAVDRAVFAVVAQRTRGAHALAASELLDAVARNSVGAEEINTFTSQSLNIHTLLTT